MRPALLALLASAAIVSATGCAQDNINELAARTSCGRSKVISKCLRATADLRRLEVIEQCFIAGGCDAADATAEAAWFSHDCRAVEVAEVQEELRRRADSTTTDDSTTATAERTTAKTSSASAKTTTEKSATTAPSSTEATTTSDSSKTSTSTTDFTSTTGTTSTSSTSTGSTTSGSPTTPLVCSITTTKSTTACSVTGGKTISCYPTITAIASCAPGLICFTATAGADVCMKRDDHLTTSGFIVTIIFAVGIVAAIIAFVAVHLHGRSKNRRAEQAALLAQASSGRGEDVESSPFARSNPAASDANLPLIAPEGQRSDQYNASRQDYFEQGQQGRGPRLNQGLGALGQDTHY